MFIFKRKVVFIGLVLILFLQCKKDDDFLYSGQFDTRFVIPSGLSTVLTHYITLQNVYTDVHRRANNAGLDIEKIKSIKTSYGRMLSTLPGDDLDFIQDISVTLISRTNSALKTEMYYSEFVPFNVDNEIRLQSGAAELKQILKDDFVDIEIRLNLRGFVPNSIEVLLDMSYVVY